MGKDISRILINAVHLCFFQTSQPVERGARVYEKIQALTGRRDENQEEKSTKKKEKKKKIRRGRGNRKCDESRLVVKGSCLL